MNAIVSWLRDLSETVKTRVYSLVVAFGIVFLMLALGIFFSTVDGVARNLDTASWGFVINGAVNAFFCLVVGLILTIGGIRSLNRLPTSIARRRARVRLSVQGVPISQIVDPPFPEWEHIFDLMELGAYRNLFSSPPKVERTWADESKASMDRRQRQSDAKWLVNKRIALATYVKLERSAQGADVFTFTTPKGMNDDAVIAMMEPFRSYFHYVTAAVIADDPRAGIVKISFSRIDYSKAMLNGYDAPVLHLSQDDINNPYLWLPVAVDDHGNTVDVPQFAVNLGANRIITEGDSGSGKASIVDQQALHAIKCPWIRVIGSFGKASAAARYRPYVQSFESTFEGVEKQIRWLKKERDRRDALLEQHIMTQRGRVDENWNIWDDGDLIVWYLDEPDKIWGDRTDQEKNKMWDDIQSILSVGRSLGIAANWVSQTWDYETIKPKTRRVCFNVAIGYHLSGIQDSMYIGFTSEDKIRPDLIGGNFVRERGVYDTVGRFASRGLEKNGYGKSYFLPRDLIADNLDEYFAVHPMTKEPCFPEKVSVV